MTEKWEYYTTLMRAEVGKKGVKTMRGNVEKFAPEAIIPELDALGEEGWELVHMQPAFVGKNDDIMMSGVRR